MTKPGAGTVAGCCAPAVAARKRIDPAKAVRMRANLSIGTPLGETESWMDEIILVDANDVEVGQGSKMEVHRRGQLHRAFSVFVFDKGGRLLLQQRAAGKYHSPGLWSNTCCGHPRSGETTAQSAGRRLREEMGIDCALTEAFAFPYRAPGRRLGE